MPLGSIARETIGTLAEEVGKKATKRTTYDQLVTENVKKARLSDKVDEITGKPTEDLVAKELETPPVSDFVDIREADIKREKSEIFLQGQKVDEEITEYKSSGVTRDNNYDGQLKILQEKRQALYVKANNRKKELESTQIVGDGIKSGIGGYKTIYNMLSSSLGRGRAIHNKEALATSIYNRVNAPMGELKDKLRTKWAGLYQDLEFHNEVIRYLKDGKIKNKKILKEVKEVAEQWKNGANKLKGLRAKAGAKIGDLEDWILPQSHNANKIKEAKYKTWRKSIITKLDVKRIEAEQGTDIETVLQSSYKNITKPQVERSGGTGSAVVNRGKDSRVLHFKTGDDIIEYNKEFGNPDIFATMDNHIRSQSDEIAMMKLFGGNPNQTYEKMKELARADGMGSNAEGKLDALWRGVSGQADGDSIISKADEKFANRSGAFRSIMISSKLGSAMVSALGDLGNIFLGAGYRDLNSIKIAGRGLQGLLQEAVGGTKTGANLKLANRIGVVSEFANASLANSRFADSVGSGFAQKAAEVVIRSSGLGSYTESMQAAFGLELAANISENFGKQLKDVPFQKMLREYGIDDAMWDIVRNSKATHEVKSAEFFDVTKLYDIDEDLAYKMSDMMTNEMNSFIIMPTERTRVYTTAGTKKGTVAGEAIRTITMFKSFPITVMMMHLNRASTMTGLGKTAYAGKVIGTGLVMGTVTLWAYDLATGKTPRSIDRKAMIGEALTKSGGLGIFGDFFIGMTETKYGNSFSDMLMGAAPAAVDDIIKSAQDLMVKDGDVAVGNIYKRVTSYIPGQNLWYTRAIIEKSIGEWVGDVVDPKHQQKKRRRQKAMRLRGQEELF